MFITFWNSSMLSLGNGLQLEEGEAPPLLALGFFGNFLSRSPLIMLDGSGAVLQEDDRGAVELHLVHLGCFSM